MSRTFSTNSGSVESLKVSLRCGCRPIRERWRKLISQLGDLPAGPFYGFNRPGAKPVLGVIQNWWRQAMMGSAKAQYDGIKVFSDTDFAEGPDDHSTCRHS